MKKVFLLVLLAALLFTIPGFASNQSVQPSSAARILKITHAAYIRPTLEFGKEIDAFNKLIQKNIGLDMYFLDWSISGQNGIYFDDYLVNKIRQTFGNNGPVIMLTWQPMSGKKPGCSQDYGRSIPLSDIIAGACDTYIRKFAQAIKARPERFLIRFAHEMNIMDSPWWPGHYNQDATVYVQMYRHVYDVFMSENVPNVEWVWSPNVGSWPVDAWNERNQYYPGDQYVDWIGLSGLNWNTPWYWFSDIFDSSIYNYAIRDFTCRYAKPQILTEFGSVEGSGGAQTKAAWISDAYQQIAQFPFMRSVLWFNDGSPTAAFQVTTFTGSGTIMDVNPLPTGTGVWTDAYKQAISSPIYNSTFPNLQDATPPAPYCGDGSSSYSVTPAYSQVTGLRQSSIHQITGMLYDQNLTLSLRVPIGSKLSGTFSPSIMPAPWGKSTLTIQTSHDTPPGIYDVAVQGNGIDLLTIKVYVNYSIIFLPFINKP